jgi:hypothetical protein
MSNGMSRITSWMVVTMIQVAIAVTVGWEWLQRVQHELGRVHRIFRDTFIH